MWNHDLFRMWLLKNSKVKNKSTSGIDSSSIITIFVIWLYTFRLACFSRSCTLRRQLRARSATSLNLVLIKSKSLSGKPLKFLASSSSKIFSSIASTISTERGSRPSLSMTNLRL